MSLYVRVMNSFYTHRKTLRLKSLLGDAAYWIPPRIWAYASQQQPDGCFQHYTAAEIATAIAYTADATAMLEALLQAGFMDADPLRIHDWDEHNGYHATFARRAKTAANARWNTRSGKRKGYRKERETSIAKPMLVASRPTLDEIRAYCEKASLPASDAEWFFHKCEGNGWTNAGRPIKSWTSTISAWKAAGYMPSQKSRPQPNLPGIQSPAAVPVFAQIKATESIIADVDKQLRAIPNPAQSVFPEEAAAAEARRKPLRERKAQLTQKLQALRTQQAGGAHA